MLSFFKFLASTLHGAARSQLCLPTMLLCKSLPRGELYPEVYIDEQE